MPPGAPAVGPAAPEAVPPPAPPPPATAGPAPAPPAPVAPGAPPAPGYGGTPSGSYPPAGGQPPGPYGAAPPAVAYGAPPAPGYPGQPAVQPVQGMQAVQSMQQVMDPHGVGMAANRLSSGARRAGKVALAVLTAVLEPEDVAEIVIQGRVHGVPGVAALVGTKVVLVNERFWKPEVLILQLGTSVQVQGWQDERTATVLMADGNQQEVVERVPDRLLAVEFAQRVRDRVAHVAAQGAAGAPAAPGMPPQPGLG
jgi:hypothetical protein